MYNVLTLKFKSPFYLYVDDPISRHRRDLTQHGEKFMEVLLVTDRSVVDFHGRGFLEQYLMTQMNLVCYIELDSDLINMLSGVTAAPFN